mgnify:CR=1 FL=1
MCKRATQIAKDDQLKIGKNVSDMLKSDLAVEYRVVSDLKKAMAACEKAQDYVTRDQLAMRMKDDEWASVIDTNLSAAFRLARSALKGMLKRRFGRIVSITSIVGVTGNPGQANYAAAKAGVMALTRCAAMEAAAHNVRINAVSPSLAMHPFLAKVTPDGLLEELEAREAFGRAAEPWEVANVMVMLASDYTTYMTGEVVAVSSQHA